MRERPRPRLRWTPCRRTDPRAGGRERSRASSDGAGGRVETQNEPESLSVSPCLLPAFFVVSRDFVEKQHCQSLSIATKPKDVLLHLQGRRVVQPRIQIAYVFPPSSAHHVGLVPVEFMCGARRGDNGTPRKPVGTNLLEWARPKTPVDPLSRTQDDGYGHIAQFGIPYGRRRQGGATLLRQRLYRRQPSPGLATQSQAEQVGWHQQIRCEVVRLPLKAALRGVPTLRTVLTSVVRKESLRMAGNEVVAELVGDCESREAFSPPAMVDDAEGAICQRQTTGTPFQMARPALDLILMSNCVRIHW